ncbi:hypothetical protein BDF20DRAFT_877062 [Mycotypha africana]|uniref:uncharacterized protein n=1 Tax=Mycotypha africana TaxID=64632 RepID=UPI0023015FAC|nr:uncharacterized protein BDF20DRAFT_877062 [Mycotypha africana]KAI8975138.1 hypothetical protein BDF20DRAFT_877062 [Mycotypha africana]
MIKMFDEYNLLLEPDGELLKMYGSIYSGDVKEKVFQQTFDSIYHEKNKGHSRLRF